MFDQLYIITTGIGFVYVMLTAFSGIGGDDNDAAGDGDSGDSSDGGASDAPDGGSDDAPDGGNTKLSTRGATSTSMMPQTRSTSLFFAITKILSPLKIALLLFNFGAAGIVISKSFPALSLWSPLPAAIISYFLSNLIFYLLGRMIRSFEKTDSFRKDDAIGQVGQLTVPIFPGATGEITFMIRGSRTNAPAKALKTEGELAKSTKVIIADIRNGVYYVEPYDGD